MQKSDSTDETDQSREQNTGRGTIEQVPEGRVGESKGDGQLKCRLPR